VTCMAEWVTGLLRQCAIATQGKPLRRDRALDLYDAVWAYVFSRSQQRQMGAELH
jgi:hypothetical protein